MNTLINGENWVMGIDPGLTGGIVAMKLDRSEVRVFKAPTIGSRIDPRGFRSIVEGINKNGKIVFTVIEQASVMPNQGSVSGFTIGVNYSMYIASLMLMGMDFEEIRPAEWRKSIVGTISIRKKKKETPEDPLSEIINQKLTSDRKKAILKTQSILIAKKMFSSIADKLTKDGPAEAALICEACRRMVLSGSMGGPETDPKVSILEAINQDDANQLLPRRGRKKAVEKLITKAGEGDVLEVGVA